VTEFNENDTKASSKSSSNGTKAGDIENKNRKGLESISELLEKAIAVSCSLKDMVKGIKVEEIKEVPQKISNVQRISNNSKSKQNGGIGFGL
jgi:hypothetical protein